MDKVSIIFCSDSEAGSFLEEQLNELRLNTQAMPLEELRDHKLWDDNNIFILYIEKISNQLLLKELLYSGQINSQLKLVICDELFCSSFKESSTSFSNIEFFSTPLHSREFLFSVEQVVLVREYRKVLDSISSGSTSRLELFNKLILSEKTDKINLSREKEFFNDLLDFEKKIIMEQLSLNESVREIATFRNMEFLTMQERVNAEELLDTLRREELREAKSVIEAQESLIDYSSMELHEAKKIIDAKESVELLSRSEALVLHDDLRLLKEENINLKEKIKQLTK